MPCDPEILRQVPLFALLDDDESCVLASQVEVKNFVPRQRIYKIGDSGGRAYVMVSGSVRLTTIDEDNQEVVVDEPAKGEFFGFASMLDGTPHHTTAVAWCGVPSSIEANPKNSPFAGSSTTTS